VTGSAMRHSGNFFLVLLHLKHQGDTVSKMKIQ
jgi:hypothetical protein